MNPFLHLRLLTNSSVQNTRRHISCPALIALKSAVAREIGQYLLCLQAKTLRSSPSAAKYSLPDLAPAVLHPLRVLVHGEFKQDLSKTVFEFSATSLMCSRQLSRFRVEVAKFHERCIRPHHVCSCRQKEASVVQAGV